MQHNLANRTAMLLAAVGLLLGALGIFGPQLAHGEPSDPPANRIAEVGHTFVMPDDSFLRITALVDTAVAQPEAAFAELVAGLTQDGGETVGAAYAADSAWAATDTPVPVTYNPAFDPAGIDGASAMVWAIESWNAVPGQLFSFVNGGWTTSVSSLDCNASAVRDGVNSIRFASGMPTGILGSTCIRGNGSVRSFNRIREFDIRISLAIQWSVITPTPRNRFDLYTVMLHEMGHALGLDHTGVSGSVMVPEGNPGEQIRVPGTDDIAGIRFLYPGPTPTPTVSPTPAPPTPTPIPPRGPLIAGINLVEGPRTGAVAADVFVQCLPAGSWAALYRWDPVAQTWQHYIAGAPFYVNRGEVQGIDAVGIGDLVALLMTRAVTTPRFVESRFESCRS